MLTWQIWCFLLPLGLSSLDLTDVDWTTTLAIAMVALLLLVRRTVRQMAVANSWPLFSLPNDLTLPTFTQAVDEVASQMEDPFEHIPVDDIVSTYERDINRCELYRWNL